VAESKNTRRCIQHLWLVQFIADLLAIVAAYYTTLGLRFYSAWGENLFNAINRLMGINRSGPLGLELEAFYLASAVRIIAILCCSLCFFYAFFDLYSDRRFIRSRPITWHIILSNIIALLLFYGYWYLSRNQFHPRSLFATLIFLNILYCIGFRRALNLFLHWLSTSNIDVHRAVLLGDTPEAQFLNVLISESEPLGIRIVHQIPLKDPDAFDDLIESTRGYMAEHPVDMLIAADARLSIPQIVRLMELSDECNASIKVLSNTLDALVYQGRIPVAIKKQQRDDVGQNDMPCDGPAANETAI